MAYDPKTTKKANSLRCRNPRPGCPVGFIERYRQTQLARRWQQEQADRKRRQQPPANEETRMTQTPSDPLRDDDMTTMGGTTSGPDADTVDADSTDADSTDADSTDADSTDA